MPQNPRDADEALATAPRTSTAVADDAFGVDLFRLLTEQSGDVVFSPASVAAALRLALCGARGETAAELAAALHLTSPADAAAAGLRALSDLEREVAATESVTFRVANTVWVQSGLPLEPAFTTLLGEAASAAFAAVDFAAAPESARAKINEAIGEQTAGKITGLLAPGTVDALTRLVLANAVYLKAPWAHPFKPNATSDEPFYPADGQSLNVPMMHGNLTLEYLRRDAYQAVLLPYLGHSLAMAVVLPDGPLADLGPKLADGGLRGLLAGAARHHVKLSLPRFRLKTGANLVSALRQLGVSRAFTKAADFTGITQAAKLQIGAIAHQAYIDVDEHGTEAAAATAVVFMASSVARPIAPVTMVVDRPFLFAVIDTTTNTPLFLGQVTTPNS
jgi:serpin B